MDQAEHSTEINSTEKIILKQNINIHNKKTPFVFNEDVVVILRRGLKTLCLNESVVVGYMDFSPSFSISFLF